jgi:hypothetical protein
VPEKKTSCAKCEGAPRAPSSSYCKSCRIEYDRERKSAINKCLVIECTIRTQFDTCARHAATVLRRHEVYCVKCGDRPRAVGDKSYCNDCRYAYAQEWRIKNPEYMRKWVARNRPRITRECITDGCSKTVKFDVCAGHSPTVGKPPRDRDSGSYQAVHARLRTVRGPARLLTCVECGRSAEQWSYDHCDPDERTGKASHGRTVRYSADIDHYRPLCVPCHRIADGILLWGERPSVHHVAPVAPVVEWTPGEVGSLVRSGLIDLRKPPEWTGVRRRCFDCGMTKDEGSRAVSCA